MGDDSLLVSAEIYPVSSFDSSIEFPMRLRKLWILEAVIRVV